MARRTNRELVMLADTYNRAKHRSAGMFLSEKLDGMRCLWLPPTRGMPIGKIPFANRDKDNRNHTASGLWSRYGKVIHCPEFFVDGFPDYPLDGELYLGRGGFQTLMSVCKTLEPNPDEWKYVQYKVFDAPKYDAIFQDGRVNNPQFSKTISLTENCEALGIKTDHPAFKQQCNFEATLNLLKRDLVGTTYLSLHEQTLLPFSTPMALDIIDKRLTEVTANHGEGLMLRHPASCWEPIRSSYLLKVKRLEDGEGIVAGFRAGQGKYLGMLGSLTIEWRWGRFELSGFTDEERGLTPRAHEWARAHPGEMIPFDEVSIKFQLGEEITFIYRELSDSNVPKEGRYLRKRPNFG